MRTSPSSGRKTAMLLLTLLLTSTGALVPPAASASEHPRHGLIRGEVARPTPPPAAPLPVRDGPVAAATARAAQVLATDQVALRPLVIALDSADFGLPTWKAVLNRAGSPYDVLYAKSDPLTAAKLVRNDGVGKYNAILLTDNALLCQDGGGNYVSPASTRPSGTRSGTTSATTRSARSRFTPRGATSPRTTACAPASKAASAPPSSPR